jgi:type III pantothenate kinase
MPSLLVLDAGNTRFKWALHNGSVWAAQGTVPVADVRNTTGLITTWREFPIHAAIASNVAGEAVRAAIAAALKPRRVPLQFIQAVKAQCGVINGYANPSQLGADRWAALIAAHHLGPAGSPKLVVMAGTALTIDALRASGEFLGGAIMPGPRLMRESLNRCTANLPLEKGAHAIFPVSTEDAITTGAAEASVGGITRMYAHLAAREGGTPVCIASGGAFDELGTRLSLPITIIDNLVLEGLLRIHQETDA